MVSKSISLEQACSSPVLTMQALGHSLDMLRLSMAGMYIYHLRHLRCAAMYAVCYPGAFFIPFADFPFLVYRAAMLGYVILAYVEYNQELRKAALLVYSQLQQQGSGSIGL